MRRQHEVANELFRPAQNNNYNETHNVQRDAAVPSSLNGQNIYRKIFISVTMNDCLLL